MYKCFGCEMQPRHVLDRVVRFSSLKKSDILTYKLTSELTSEVSDEAYGYIEDELLLKFLSVL